MLIHGNIECCNFFTDLRTGKFCGNDFPHLITSSGRSLWMRFHSDSTIQYHGFRAVYTFVENPLDPITDIGRCAFQVRNLRVFVRQKSWNLGLVRLAALRRSLAPVTSLSLARITASCTTCLSTACGLCRRRRASKSTCNSLTTTWRTPTTAT